MLLLTAAAAAFLSVEQRQAAFAIRHTLEVESQLNRVQTLITDAETGQRGYPLKLNSFDPQHRDLAIDPHTPGDQGPTYHGVARVPKGETYSRDPETGPQLPNIPAGQ